MQIYFPRSTQLLLAAAALVVSSTVSVCNAEHSPEVKELVDWFEAREGTEFNPKQEIRREVPDDPDSVLGVFATDDIAKGEVLVSIPWDTIIHAGYQVTDPPPLVCDTARRLANEMRRGDDSEFAPYAKYLMKQRAGQLPSAWSKAGRELFIEVLGEELPPMEPVSWLEEDWREDCNGSTEPLDEHAALLVVQRAEDDLMIPIYDMYSHRNGHYHNIDNNREEGKRFYLTAKRDIAKGEQIYNSYNMCNNCGGRANSYGTPDIFRDYGFVEQFPQRWIFAGRRFAFDLKEVKGSPGKTAVTFAKGVTLAEESISWMKKEIWRLERLKKLEADNTELDPYELDMLWEYVDALVNAMKLAIKATPGADLDAPCDASDESCSASDGYDPLDDEKDDLYYDESEGHYYKPVTCDNQEIMRFDDYNNLESLSSIYQTLTYVEKKDIDDVCFDLDDVVQICSSYRPHYHEYNMDFAARYVDDVRRVIFVGGGDSMLLYETLKYPNIEKVVGLELDQKVVRKSFKYFHTQPHFDDERVEWWFGDATKSLLMLPRDYFSSFDLVLIDLSETVMSLSVNSKLDVFNALALLLRPGGVMVKNELYLEKITQLFDYTVQIYRPDLPIICDQVVVLGSNSIDFFRHERTDHKVGTKLLEPIENHPHELFHDYRRTSALEQGQCDDDESEPDEEMTGRSAILMVAEVENTTVPLKPFNSLVSKLLKVLKNEGMNPIDTKAPDNEDAVSTVIAMREGHVTIRVWPDQKYCALDIHLWSSFNKMEQLRDALVKALGSDHSSLSSYRIVTGGMKGTSTWNEDHKTIGPLIEQRRSCDGVDYVKEGDLNSKETNDIVMDEALNLIQGDGALAAVLCGPTKDDCKSLDAVSRHPSIDEVIFVPTCPELAAASEFSENIGDLMVQCEKEVLVALRAATSEGGISAIIVDPSAPVTMLKIASSIWSSQRNFNQLLTEHFVIVSLMPDHRDTWRKRHNLMDRVRRALIYDPMFAAELVISSSDKTMEVGILSTEDPDFFMHLEDVVKNVEERTSGLDVNVRKVQGALVKAQTEYDPQFFRKDDYDLEDSLMQYVSQKSVGRQTVFQLNIEEGGPSTSSAAIEKALSETTAAMGYTITGGITLIEKEIGDGAMASAVMEEGTVVVAWDGETRIDINLFTFDETEQLATDFMTHMIDRIPKLKLMLRDEQPRGINRVVNFAEDYDKKEDTEKETE